MIRSRRQVLTTTTALFGVTLLLLVTRASAFDPNEGQEPQHPAANAQHLPDPSVLYEAPGSIAPSAAPPTVLATGPGAPGYISPLPPMSMPTRPLYPERSVDAIPAALPKPSPAPPIVTTAAPEYPPVSPDVATKAQAMMGDTPAPSPPSTPLSADAAATPVDLAAPLSIAPPATKLSDQTREILGAIPSSMDTAKPTKASDIKLDRVSPDISAILGESAKEDQFESVGLSIKVRRPGLDATHELGRAYTALMGGDTQQAITIYKEILSTDAKNQDALFGLAATYHRQSAVDKARPLYGMLLKLNPNHREGLNNFLVLVSDESPQDAMPELERLEERNPDFSPIPAQSAIVLDKLGYKDLARDKMLRAIELAPENLTYKYNLAVMLDRQGRYSDAKALYKVLIEAALRGEKVPATVDVMQKRLNFLTTMATTTLTPGG